MPPIAWTAAWAEPLTGGVFVANPGRTIPIKFEIFANGVEQSRGAARFAVETCAGASVLETRLEWDGGRWTAHLDTGRLGGSGCFVATVVHDGSAASSIRMELRGEPAPNRDG